LRVVGNIVEDFSKLTFDQKRKAPILETPSRTIDFGIINPGAKKPLKFRISNKGINPLEIRRVINNNKEIFIQQSKMSIPGGKSGVMIIDINAKTLPEGDYKNHSQFRPTIPTIHCHYNTKLESSEIICKIKYQNSL